MSSSVSACEAQGRPRLATLTPQERRILDLIAEGYTNRQIAETMFLAEKTVKNYVSNLLAKLGMERRTQAATFAARLNERSAQDAFRRQRHLARAAQRKSEEPSASRPEPPSASVSRWMPTSFSAWRSRSRSRSGCSKRFGGLDADDRGELEQRDVVADLQGEHRRHRVELVTAGHADLELVTAAPHLFDRLGAAHVVIATRPLFQCGVEQLGVHRHRRSGGGQRPASSRARRSEGSNTTSPAVGGSRYDGRTDG